MAKRGAEVEEGQQAALKAGHRPLDTDASEPALEFEDEYEDEFESEDEIMEAGVDGRPDVEREAEQAQSMWAP